MKTTILSIVITGRNDNHNGDFNLRAELAMRHNAALLEHLNLSAEWVWVEWNPIPQKPLLSESVKQWLNPLNVIIVPSSIHTNLCDNPHMGMMQFHAKNAGIRRAAGEWILSMNADTYLTDDVLIYWQNNMHKKKTLFLAERHDFSKEYLSESPAVFPIKNLDQIPTVNISAININENKFGSAGDFTMLHKNMFRKTGGHYEGIRFSNSHLDSLLCRQALHFGTETEVAGAVYHADHSDSWNNFTIQDALQHHHGSDYNCHKIALPYENNADWGLLSAGEKILPGGEIELSPPSGAKLRTAVPQKIIIPDEFKETATAASNLSAALDKAIRERLRVVVYGFGDQLKRSCVNNQLNNLDIVGYIDDNDADDPLLPYPKLTWQKLESIKYDALLIGSLYWADELRQKALTRSPSAKILP